MTATAITGEVRRFLLAVIPSVPHLEALLLLRAQPRAWGVPELARRLYVDEAPVQALLDDLAQAGLVASGDGGVRYAPAAPDVMATVDEVALAYGRHVVAVTELIHSTSDRKAQRFADAFRLRKEP
ncbi:MAG TPA: hypothetical protein VLM17_06855 [Xanthomonadaceae bacterium]|nr:hypothetical protein [Xanthomonadaceae bacterium]